MNEPKAENLVFFTMHQAAILLGVTYPRLQQILNEQDAPPRETNKTFRSDKFGTWMRARAVRLATTPRNGQMPLGAGGQPDPDKLDAVQQRARKDKELADKTALENQTRRGELVEASTVRNAWIDIVSRTKSRLLRIPFSASIIIVGEEDPVRIQMLLEDQIRDALNELSVEE